MSGSKPHSLHLVPNEQDTDEDEDVAEPVSEEDEESLPPGPFNQRDVQDMEDKDVQRLQDRIDAAEERGRLRLELAISRTDAKLDGLSASLQDLKTSIQELGRQSTAQAAESAAQNRELSHEFDARHRELRTLIISVGVAIFLGLGALFIGLMQVWVGGVQVGVPLGQASQAQTDRPGTSPSTSPQGSSPRTAPLPPAKAPATSQQPPAANKNG